MAVGGPTSQEDEMSPLSTGLAALLAVCLGLAPRPVGAAEEGARTPSASPQAAAAAGEPEAAQSEIDVKKLFAAQCGWCHADYGMKPGKAPRLAGTRLNERQVASIIRNGKEGAMPAFRRSLTDEQIQAFTTYIKGLQSQQ
jgi:mono/diheme cytochrome c family protein